MTRMKLFLGYTRKKPFLMVVNNYFSIKTAVYKTTS